MKSARAKVVPVLVALMAWAFATYIILKDSSAFGRSSSAAPSCSGLCSPARSMSWFDR